MSEVALGIETGLRRGCAMSANDEQHILGRRVVRVIRNDHVPYPHVRCQLFLQFDDGTYAEIYSDGSLTVSAPREGDPSDYADNAGGTKRVYE